MVKDELERVEEARLRLHALGDSDDFAEKARLHEQSLAAGEVVRGAGDLVIAAFFRAEKAKEREGLRLRYAICWNGRWMRPIRVSSTRRRGSSTRWWRPESFGA